VFEYEEQPPVEPGDDDNVDYTGLKILAVLVPVFLLFIYLGRADMGFAVSVVLGMMMLAIKVNWEKRSHWWFWTTVVLVFALHIPLFLIARVPIVEGYKVRATGPRLRHSPLVIKLSAWTTSAAWARCAAS
jgi:hypothetical protein